MSRQFLAIFWKRVAPIGVILIMRLWSILTITLSNTSCSLIPLQAGRVDLVLHYHQTYDLENLRSRDPDGHHLGPHLLIAALGRKNYCSLPDPLRTEYLGGLFARGKNQWIADGLATAIVSPSPWWTDGFLFEVHGRYITRDFSKVIATADFYIAKQSITDVKTLLSDLPRYADKKRGLRWIDLLIRQIIIREVDLRPSPEDRRFVHESEAVLRIYLMPLSPDGVFMIAPVRHEIGIMSPYESGKVYSVGCIQFTELENEPQIFDVRSRDSIWRTKDYPELLRRAGIHEHSESFSPRWFGQSCAGDEREPMYRAGSMQSAEEWTADPEGRILERLFGGVDDPTCETPPRPDIHSLARAWSSHCW